MKFNLMLIAAIVAVLVAIFVFMPSKKSAMDSKWTVYGNNHCGWTRKQKEMMDSKGIPYKYVDCEVENCPGISGYPTLTNDDGTVKVGYTPM
jgi:hypothetical protein